MAEYIKKDEVIGKFIEGDGDDKFTEGYNFAVNEYRDTIKNIPATDVQPVTRCKDCIERPHCQTHSDDFYCAFGERSDSND